MTWPDAVQFALYAFGLLLLWAGVQTEVGLLSTLGVALLGGGVTAGGFLQLQGARETATEPIPSSSQKIVLWVRALLQTGLGLALVLGSLTSAFLGGEGLWRILTRQPGPLLLAVGAVLIAVGIQVLLGGGERMTSRWESLASLPLRLSSLPSLALGLVCLALGAAAILAPAQFQAWINATFGSLVQGP